MRIQSLYNEQTRRNKVYQVHVFEAAAIIKAQCFCATLHNKDIAERTFSIYPWNIVINCTCGVISRAPITNIHLGNSDAIKPIFWNYTYSSTALLRLAFCFHSTWFWYLLEVATSTWVDSYGVTSTSTVGATLTTSTWVWNRIFRAYNKFRGFPPEPK